MTILTDYPAALEMAGVNVRTLDGWENPEQDGYVWRESDGEPAGFMHHHTATTSYVPNRTKANAYAGLSMNDSDRLYQEDYGDGDFEPTFTIANAYPAPISSGAGDYSVLERVRQGIEVDGRQGTDTTGWYGNTHYYNVEWVLDGIGAYIDTRVWDMMVVACRVWNDMYSRNRAYHLGHYHHTRRKIDLYDGRDNNADGTINRLRTDMEADMAMSLERYATRWRNPLDFDRAAVKGIITEDESTYWKKVPTDSPEWADLRDAVEVRDPLWTK